MELKIKRITRIEFVTRFFKAVNLFLVHIFTLTSYQVGEVRATNEIMMFHSQWRHYVSVGPGARNNLGPHKVMTYIIGAGRFSTQNIFEFKVSEMAFPAF